MLLHYNILGAFCKENILYWMNEWTKKEEELKEETTQNVYFNVIYAFDKRIKQQNNGIHHHHK